MKKLVVFDLDGTLAESKAALDSEMAKLLDGLLTIAKVAVISGGDWSQFQKQLLANLSSGQLENLSLLPTNGTKFYRFESDWKLLYAENFSEAESEKIMAAFKEAIEQCDFGITKTWGEQIQNRGSQITYSALGQEAPLEAKEKWDPDFKKRQGMKAILDKLLPDFSIRLGGTTSVDVMKKGIDKAYGIKKLHEILGIEIEEMIFVGDAIFPGGNDYPAREAGVVAIEVSGPAETKTVVRTILACLGETKFAETFQKQSR
ncbi:MAG TPA: HAD-IIB family hydrolase [Fimbriimonadaceae bacterium]